MSRLQVISLEYRVHFAVIDVRATDSRRSVTFHKCFVGVYLFCLWFGEYILPLVLSMDYFGKLEKSTQNVKITSEMKTVSKPIFAHRMTHYVHRRVTKCCITDARNDTVHS